MTHTVIVGGGLTGILAALRLSTSHAQPNQHISLIDSKETLGGRFFFESGQKGKSGFGFELEDPHNLDTLKRHIFLYLTEDEKTFLDHWIHDKQAQFPLNKNPTRFFIKKDLLNAEYLLLSNSEFLTKKDADFLYSLTNSKNLNISEDEKENSFEESNLWKNTHKSIKENTLPILENTIGKKVLKLKLGTVVEKIHEIFCTAPKQFDPFFLRIFGIEEAFNQILHKRGVQIHFLSTVKSLIEENDRYILYLTGKENREIVCHKIIFTIPPYNLRYLIPKEKLSVELSKFINKIQPRSLVCLELCDVREKLLDGIKDHFQPTNIFYFPVEGAKAYMTSDARLIASFELDYETSLQAPAVREAITHLRRGLRRILKPEFANELKKGAFIRKTESFEKIILLPIAYNLPSHPTECVLPNLSTVTCQLKNVTMAGDYFHTLGECHWKRIVKSVELSLNERYL